MGLAFAAAVVLYVERPYRRGTLNYVDATLRIDINTAAAPTLTLLPRIGPALAKRIVSDREANGPFGSVADLDRVPGMGPKTIERLKGYATCGAASPTTALSPRLP